MDELFNEGHTSSRGQYYGYLPVIGKEVHEAAQSERTKSCCRCSCAVIVLENRLNEMQIFLRFLNDSTRVIIPINTHKQTNECTP